MQIQTSRGSAKNYLVSGGDRINSSLDEIDEGYKDYKIDWREVHLPFFCAAMFMAMEGLSIDF